MNKRINPSVATISRCIRLGRLGLVLGVALPFLAHAASTVTINGQRTFNITPQTTFSLDGVSISEKQAAALGAGYNVQVTIDNVNATASAGDAGNIDLRNLARGPVTSTDPLSVLEQPLVITSETVLIGIHGDDIANIVAGDLLEVSGFLDANGAMAATRVEYHDNPTTDWKLFGQVSALNGPLFSIGAQAIDSTGVTAMDCGAGLQNGQFVELETLPNPGYASGSDLGLLIQLECEDPNFDNPPPGTIAASLEGIISDLPD
ncbi:DUF5666 domain-containing protein, partial [Dokdonella sp.]|uniref:DUF5666 domain-containing protein n=1 Tax=Dokdonella sp. TaxID=2291710 RepID=UPI003C4DDCEE